MNKCPQVIAPSCLHRRRLLPFVSTDDDNPFGMTSVPTAHTTRPRPGSPARVEVVDQELLRLRRWPNLTRLPPDVDVGLAARICGLLGRKPTVGFLVARLLDVPHARVGPLLAGLHAAGYIETAGAAACAPTVAAAAADRPPAGVPDRRFIALLWRLFAR